MWQIYLIPSFAKYGQCYDFWLDSIFACIYTEVWNMKKVPWGVSICVSRLLLGESVVNACAIVLVFNINVIMYRTEHFMRSWLESWCNIMFPRNLKYEELHYLAYSVNHFAFPLVLVSSGKTLVLLCFISVAIWSMETLLGRMCICSGFCAHRVFKREKNNTIDWRGYSEKEKKRDLDNILEKRVSGFP